MTKTSKEILKNIYQKRPIDAKKYDYGLLLVIGGSEFYSGSPAFSGLAAFKAGVDMVRIIAPARAANIIASFSPVLAAYPLKGDWLTREHLPTLISMTESAKTVSHGKTAVVIGGGAGRTEETQSAIREYLSGITISAVIDADAIHAIAEDPQVIAGKQFLITPNLYEFFILTKKDIRQSSENERIEAVRKEAGRLQTTILLKGATDIISDGKDVALNVGGSPYMSKGGTGDVLAGVAGAILARGVNPFLAGQSAVFINDSAGELAAKKYGESLLATDVIEEIAKVLK